MSSRSSATRSASFIREIAENTRSTSPRKVRKRWSAPAPWRPRRRRTSSARSTPGRSRRSATCCESSPASKTPNRSGRGHLARIRDRTDLRLDLGPQVLDERRQRELLAQVLDGLVDREARPTKSCDLEEDAAGLAVVHGAEVEAVDHGRGVHAGREDAVAPGLVLLGR